MQLVDATAKADEPVSQVRQVPRLSGYLPAPGLLKKSAMPIPADGQTALPIRTCTMRRRNRNPVAMKLLGKRQGADLDRSSLRRRPCDPHHRSAVVASAKATVFHMLKPFEKDHLLEI